MTATQIRDGVDRRSDAGLRLREDVLRAFMAQNEIPSVAALARKSEISKATIFRLIGGHVNATGPVALKLAASVGATVESLFRSVP